MASIDHQQMTCHECQKHVLAQRKGCNHLVHALVTLFLFGLWIPIWILAAVGRGPWRCPNCGSALKS
jgi:hypothetical protein